MWACSQHSPLEDKLHQMFAWGIFRLALQQLKGLHRGESKGRKETALTKTRISQKIKEGRKNTKVTAWQVRGLAIPVREAAFPNEIWIITDKHEPFTDSLFPQAYSDATGNDICVDDYLLSPSWAISSSSASVFAAAIAWGNFRVNGRTSLLCNIKVNMVFTTTSKVL